MPVMGGGRRTLHRGPVVVAVEESRDEFRCLEILNSRLLENIVGRQSAQRFGFRDSGTVDVGHPKVIQERLGHASIKTTLDTYGHLFEGLDEAAADRLEEVWRASRAEPARNRASGGNVIGLKDV